MTVPIYVIGNCLYHFLSGCGLCLLGNFPIATALADYVTAVTGWDFSISDALKSGKRIQSLRQAFNVREDLHPDDFHLPERVSIPSSAGQFEGKQIDFAALKDIFFAKMGWDIKSGWPMKTTLEELGLTDLVDLD
jgi:aldehyde:ferredoxin oxidoreductase